MNDQFLINPLNRNSSYITLVLFTFLSNLGIDKSRFSLFFIQMKVSKVICYVGRYLLPIVKKGVKTQKSKSFSSWLSISSLKL